MASEDKRPRRAWVLTMSIQGDTREDVIELLKSMLYDSLIPGSPYSVHGGSDSGGHYTLDHDPEQTHDKYFECLAASR